MNGARVGITAARRAAEQAALVRALGGVPVLGPALRPDAPAPDERLAPALERVLEGPLDVAVFLTGVGAELTFALAERLGRAEELRAALAGARVLARGPKPRRALRAARIRIDWVADPPRAALIRERLAAEPLAGRRILVQGYGPPPDELAAPLRAAGAEVVVLSPYAATWPDDPGPAQALAADAMAGTIDALTFTSAQAATQFAALAEAAGLEPADLRAGGALVAAIGPVTRAALEREGLEVDLECTQARMGALYRQLAVTLSERGWHTWGLRPSPAPAPRPQGAQRRAQSGPPASPGARPAVAGGPG
jgi:uroporphyrinogen-III synthase